jgi:hypothetical protein
MFALNKSRDAKTRTKGGDTRDEPGITKKLYDSEGSLFFPSIHWEGGNCYQELKKKNPLESGFYWKVT